MLTLIKYFNNIINNNNIIYMCIGYHCFIKFHVISYFKLLSTENDKNKIIRWRQQFIKLPPNINHYFLSNLFHLSDDSDVSL